MSFTEKAKEWFKDRYNLLFVAILLFAFILRVKYFDINALSLWWDEATYLASGRYWAFGDTLWAVEAARPPFFMLMIALFFKLGFNELLVRFFTVVVPSLLIVLFTYLLGKELYDKRVGLIAALIASVSWMFLVNIARAHSDLLAGALGLAAIYYFWKGYVVPEKKNTLYLFLCGIFLGLGFMTRLSNLIVVGIIGLYLIITEQHRFLKHKQVWYAGLFLFLSVLPYLIWSKFQYGTFLAWAGQYGAGAEAAAAKPLAWNVFSVIKIYLSPQLFFGGGQDFIFYVLFFIGLIISLKFLLGIDLVVKNKSKELNADLITILMVVATIMFFVVIQRDLGDPRWQMFAAPAIFLVVARGIIWIYDSFKKYSSIAVATVLGILLLVGSVSQIVQASAILNHQKNDQAGIKSAAEWIKANSAKGQWVLSNNIHAEMTYWADRPTRGFGLYDNGTFEVIDELKPAYLVVTGYFQSLPWTYEYPGKYPERFEPAAVFDAEGKPVTNENQRPIIVIYRIEY
ncbi:glycosyltransferase family 39 protein [Candidatus Woesearchaeota archaeon]|nr:glycosyltransferase family 39 protein [Candidatus Woesearchaeota archaeon]